MENKRANRRQIMGWAAAGLSMPFGAQKAAARTPNVPNVPNVIVELFTSQGCSSCPAADNLAAELIKQPGVTVVSLNVDYWDYLGWRDTLARPEYTQRQMDYAHTRGDNDVYTPQMIIDGETHRVGNNESTVASAIAVARRKSGKIEIAIRATDEELLVSIPQGTPVPEATLWIMAIAPQIDVKVERGENAGSTLSYHNVIRKLVPAGMWDGSATTLKLPRKAIMLPDCKSCVAVLQHGKAGPVIGLGQMALTIL